jgi:hypothetical protein
VNVSDESESRPRAKWPRFFRFALTERGREAERAYREEIVASRAQVGRASFDDTRASWAKRFAIEPDDGLFLCELRESAKTRAELAAAVIQCDRSADDVKAALERMWDVGLVGDASAM